MSQNEVLIGDISSEWKRPEELMKLHLLKKKRALSARLRAKSLSQHPTDIIDKSDAFALLERRTLFEKRKNPFRCEPSKRFKEDTTINLTSSELENSSDSTLFDFITDSQPQKTEQSNVQTSFSSILSKLQQEHASEAIPQKANQYIPVDWALKSKMRLMSEKQFPWNPTLKTCEAASGITGFVRCLNSGLSPEKLNASSCSLDTSPNARFLQCCLVWQYPSFPWLSVFPRTTGRVSSTTNSFIGSNPQLQSCLYNEWDEGYRSLFQLLRALQCPYFYVCANSFTCLFRAAGIGGQTDIHAFITPTTSGFRQLLRNENVEFTMPLRKSKSTKRLSSDSNSDPGYDTLDSTDDQVQIQFSKSETGNEEEEDDDEAADEWLKSMGMDASEIKKLNARQEKLTSDKANTIDQSPESLVYVEGIEVQSLYNFLRNCKSIVSSTGPLAGIPPTLLSPVAFRGAVLRPLKVKQEKVKVDTKPFYSIEVCGPILPHTIHNLCGLLKHSHEFSMIFLHVESTKPFNEVAHVLASDQDPSDIREKTPEKNGNPGPGHTPTKTPASNALCKENLSDCGLPRSLIDVFCSSDPSHVQAVGSLRNNGDGTYTW